MTRKRDELANHIHHLCCQHGIRVIERKARGGWASRPAWTISIRAVKTERTYIIALHEIGHLIGRNRSGRRLEQEAAAWDFVLENSLVMLSDASFRFMHRCLQSYLLRATHARRRMVIPDKGHRFWQTYGAIVHRVAGSDQRLSA